MAKRRLPSNWRSRIELVEKELHGDFPAIELRLRFKLGRTPRGFDRAIGYFEASLKNPHIVEDVNIDNHFLRRGLGTLLYLHALNELGSLTTLYHSASEDAQGLWKFLVRTHRSEHDFFTGRLTIFHKRKHS